MKWIGYIVGIFSIIASVTLFYNKLHTDYEAILAAVANAEARTAIVAQIYESDKNFDRYRIALAQQEIEAIDYALKFSPLSNEEKEYKRNRRSVLLKEQDDIRREIR